ncbi:MAG: hypothetical protein ACI4RA_00565 [Kiritimatiellia bacterium]
MKKRLGVGIVAALLALRGAYAFTYSAKSYVQAGLVGHFDGVENAGYGQHDATATTWTNLVGTNLVDHLPLAQLKAWSWGDAWLNITSDSGDGRLILPRPITLTAFTIETPARTGSDGSIRRWEVTPWASSFETWCNEKEGYLERISVGSYTTRIAAYTHLEANRDIQFSTTYDGLDHKPHAVVDGVRHVNSGLVPNFRFPGKMAFYGAMKAGRAYGLRIYTRALTEEELCINNVLDQIRLLGKTPETVALPDGWRFGSDGVLRTAGGKALIRPEEGEAARVITDVAFTARTDGATACTVTLAAGESGATNALYLVWGERDYGAVAEDWPCLRRQKLVLPEETAVTFALPDDCTTYAQDVHVRVFSAVAARPYDYRLDSVGASGTQWLDTDYYANLKTVADVTATFSSLVVQQRVFGSDGDPIDNPTFNFSAYINGGGNWAFSAHDGAGGWTGSGQKAKAEKTRLIVSAPEGSLTVHSASYPRAVTTNNTEQTATSETALALFASARRDRHICLAEGCAIHGATFSEDGKILRCYEPCVAAGRPGFYESVSGRVYHSSTADDFLETGANIDTACALGERLAGSSETKLVPHDGYRVKTDSLLTVDYRLLYMNGGGKLGTAPLVLTHPENDFGGVFSVYDGLLAADFGAGLATTDHLVLDGGVWAPGGATLDVPLGAGAGQVELKGARAGFGAYAGDMALTFNGGAGPITYPAANFAPAAVVLNDAFCTHTITVAQGFEGDGATPLTLEVGGGTAVLQQGFTGFPQVTKTGAGTARFMAGEYSFGGLAFAGGRSLWGTAAGASATTIDLTGDLYVTNLAQVALEQTTLTAAKDMVTAVGADVTVRNSSLTVAQNVQIATLSRGNETGTGTLTLDNAALTAPAVRFGNWNGWGQYGNLVVTNDASLTAEQFHAMRGTAHQYGGTVRVTGEASTDPRINDYTYWLHGGTFERVSQKGNFQLGRDGTGRMYVEKAGRLVTHCQYPSIGRIRKQRGELFVRNGGRFDAGYMSGKDAVLCVADEGSGLVEVASGGVIDVVGFVKLADGYEWAERTAEMRVLAGGTVRTRGLWRQNSPCTFTKLILDGGLVQVRADGALKVPFTENMTSAQLGVNGATFDTNGRDVVLRQDFVPREGQTWTAPTTAEQVATCAAFTKVGAGTLTMNGSNSYAVATCVAEGTLVAGTAHALPTGGLVRLAGGTLDLGVTGQRIGSLAGSGRVTGGTLAVTEAVWPGVGGVGGVLTVSGCTLTTPRLHYAVSTNEAGEVACGRLVHTGLLDLRGVEVVIDDVEKLGAKGRVLAEAGTLVGTPTGTLPRPYRVLVQGSALKVVSATGTVVFVR